MTKHPILTKKSWVKEKTVGKTVVRLYFLPSSRKIPMGIYVLAIGNNELFGIGSSNNHVRTYYEEKDGIVAFNRVDETVTNALDAISWSDLNNGSDKHLIDMLLSEDVGEEATKSIKERLKER